MNGRIRGTIGTGHIARVLAALAVGLAAGCATASGNSTAGRAASETSAYPWPLKPFNRPHPVRAVVGDPRTTFLHPLRGDALAGSGLFSFHDGVDIDAPNGTRVYSVVSGTVRSVTQESVVVEASDGRAFVYMHIVPAARAGQIVTAQTTVLGRVENWALELHFSEVSASGLITNPLLPGHLAPYRDTTKPIVAALVLRTHGSDTTVRPFEVRGRVDVIADAYDLPELPAKQGFATTHFEHDRFGVAPAALKWSLSTLEGRTVVRTVTAVDFRSGLPTGSLWSVYARGTYQNRAPIVPRYHKKLPGRYLFVLTRLLDTRRLRDGLYVVTVTAVDAAGNAGSLRTPIEIRNHDARVQ